MLTTKLIHPGIIRTLSLCGHGSKILIADGNYPLAAKTGNAEKIYLGLTEGLPTVMDVLKAIHSVVNIEKAEVMFPTEGPEPEIFSEFREELQIPLEGCGRFEYYDVCCEPDVLLAISTGDTRRFANILLTIDCAG